MKKQLRRWIKTSYKNQSGTTLVELMVCFVILGILMTATIAVISPAANVYNRISNSSKAISVSDTLMQKITGELSQATKVDAPASNQEEEQTTISYQDSKRRPVTISKGEGQTNGFQVLHLEYFPAQKEQDADSKYVDWKLDDATYMSNQIQNLTFKFTYAKNDTTNTTDYTKPILITIYLELKNIDTQYTFTREKTIALPNS